MVSEDTRDFKPAPEGLFPAVCVDVVDNGIVDGIYGAKHKIQIRWQLDPKSDAGSIDGTEQGRPWLIVRSYTLSLHEKSALRPFLESWRGKKFTPEELRGFDVEKLLGAPCLLQVFHRQSMLGRTFANVQNIMPLPKTMSKPQASADYVRVKDRPDQPPAAGSQGPRTSALQDDDDWQSIVLAEMPEEEEGGYAF